MKSLLVYKFLLIISFPIAVVLRSVFYLFLYLLSLISGSTIFISDIYGGLSLALIMVSFMAFCLVSIYQILKRENRGNNSVQEKQKSIESNPQNK